MDRNELGVFGKCQKGCLIGTMLGMPHVMTMNKTDTYGPPQPIACKAKL